MKFLCGKDLGCTLRLCSLLIVFSGLAGCATPYNYENFRRAKPRSILVIPPLNNATDVRGTYSYLSTVTLPIAEKGFYVFPVAVVDQMMKENGVQTAHDMHQISLKKISEIIGPDAVLYLTLEEYGTKYVIVQSQTEVTVSGKLVDARTGTTLWEGRTTANDASSSGGGGLSSLITAVVVQAVNSSVDHAHEVSQTANSQLFFTEGHGLLNGPYHPQPSY
jgi:hypothetical protein